jgi:hypothetical protein
MTLAAAGARISSVVNATRKQVLHGAPEVADTHLRQGLGFMFQRPKDRCIVFLFLPARTVRMHMCFVFGAIDILALDGTGKVIAMRERFSPFTFWHPRVVASCVVELPVGTIARTGTRMGDTVVCK